MKLSMLTSDRDHDSVTLPLSQLNLDKLVNLNPKSYVWVVMWANFNPHNINKR